jgi:hypothetical protein
MTWNVLSRYLGEKQFDYLGEKQFDGQQADA